jgi:propionate CoA-transferase
VVLYVTERCVFERTPAGLELIEVAAGIDLDRDVLGLMDFKPLIRNVRPMDPRIFRAAPMGLDHTLLGRNLTDRISYDLERNILFVNFEGFEVRTIEDVDRIRREVERRCRDIGKPVAMIASYDGFYLDPLVSDTYFSMIAYLEKRYYSSASRYTTSAFMRLKLGEALAERHVAAHIFETQEEAQQFAAYSAVRG